MGMDDCIVENSALIKDCILQSDSSGDGLLEAESTMEVLTRVELDLACSSEKLVNLQVLLMHLLAWDNDLDTTVKDDIPETSIEKALLFDLLFGILDSEVREVQTFLDYIQEGIVYAREKVSSCRHLKDLFAIMEEKLHDSEESMNKSQDQIVEIRTQLAKLQRAFSAFRLDNWSSKKLLVDNQLLNISANSKRQAAEQQRLILRMLEKSLARELDLEKKLSELRQNEEQLKLKLHYTEQVAFRMEEAAEVVWGRFLEAENASEVLMGISKEMVGRLQIVQFNQNGAVHREVELKSKLEDCIQSLNAKDAALKNLENSITEHITRSSEMPTLKQKVKSLEEQLKKSELRLQDANALNEESHEQLNELETIIESLKESVYEVESRAEAADAKVMQLSDTNAELTDEINFLKGSADDNRKNVNSLETQVRELEVQLQHAKASSEASQEQQNMLYSAIWDMETLIDDLKSKVSKAENKTENVEEQCIILSEANMDLNNEISFLRSRVKTLEESLDQANNSRAATAKEINRRTGLIMDTVTQLASERERIQNQLFLSIKENKILLEKLRNAKGDASAVVCNNVNGDDKKFSPEIYPSGETCAKASEEAVSLSNCLQVDKASDGALANETRVETSNSTNEAGAASSRLEVVRKEEAGKSSLAYFEMAIFVAVVAATVIYILHKKPVFLLEL